MKYFVVSVDSNYVAPVPVGWQGIIDKKTIHRKKVYEIQEHLLFRVESHMQTVYTDVITFPCFMVSETVKKVISKYQPFLKYTRVVLLQKEKETSMAYYIPFLEQAGKGMKNGTGKLLLGREQTDGRIIAEIQAGDNIRIMMRMDLVEGILRRKTVGVGLEEIVLT